MLNHKAIFLSDKRQVRRTGSWLPVGALQQTYDLAKEVLFPRTGFGNGLPQDHWPVSAGHRITFSRRGQSRIRSVSRRHGEVFGFSISGNDDVGITGGGGRIPAGHGRLQPAHQQVCPPAKHGAATYSLDADGSADHYWLQQ